MRTPLWPAWLILLPHALGLRTGGKEPAAPAPLQGLVQPLSHHTVRDVPVGDRGSLQHGWEISLLTPSRACRADDAGSTCTFSILSAANASSPPAESAPTFVARAVGPELRLCETRAASLGGGGFATSVSCSVRTGGRYELLILLTYESPRSSEPEPPKCSTPCICSYLKVNGSSPAFVAPHPESRAGQDAGLPSEPPGRWLRRGADEWHWIVGQEERDLNKDMPPPKSCPRLHLIGDSHMQRTYSYLKGHGFDVNFSVVHGIRNHNFAYEYDEVRAEASRGNCAFRAHRGGQGRMSLLGAVAALANVSRGDVVVLGAGTWDLRDEGLETFAGDLRKLARALDVASARFPDVSFVYRNAPAYSYKHTGLLDRREYRTNEKFRKAAEAARSILPSRFPIWDSFSVTMPLFEWSIDSHHYLALDMVPDNDTEATAKNRIGQADTNMLLYMLCSPRAGHVERPAVEHVPTDAFGSSAAQANEHALGMPAFMKRPS